jgi:hypothetical protein
LNPQGTKYRRILSPLRLPVPPSRLFCGSALFYSILCLCLRVRGGGECPYRAKHRETVWMRRATCSRDFARCGQRSVTADRQAVPHLAVSDGVVKSGPNLDEAVTEPIDGQTVSNHRCKQGSERIEPALFQNISEWRAQRLDFSASLSRNLGLPERQSFWKASNAPRQRRRINLL